MTAQRKMLDLAGIECCALLHAFAKNPQAIAVLSEFVPMERIRMFGEIFTGRTPKGRPAVAKRLRCELTEEDMLIYRTVADAEMARLKDGEPGFRCTHTREHHEEALLSVLALTAIVTH